MEELHNAVKKHLSVVRAPTRSKLTRATFDFVFAVGESWNRKRQKTVWLVRVSLPFQADIGYAKSEPDDFFYRNSIKFKKRLRLKIFLEKPFIEKLHIESQTVSARSCESAGASESGEL